LSIWRMRFIISNSRENGNLINLNENSIKELSRPHRFLKPLRPLGFNDKNSSHPHISKHVQEAWV
jgi:hypothetical protein